MLSLADRMFFSERVVKAHEETPGSCRVSLPSSFFTKNLSRAISLKPATSNRHDFTSRRSRTHRDVIVNNVIFRLCVHKNIGGFKFGDLVAHRQTAKLNVLPTFLRLRYNVKS